MKTKPSAVSRPGGRVLPVLQCRDTLSSFSHTHHLQRYLHKGVLHTRPTEHGEHCLRAELVHRVPENTEAGLHLIVLWQGQGVQVGLSQWVTMAMMAIIQLPFCCRQHNYRPKQAVCLYLVSRGLRSR